MCAYTAAQTTASSSSASKEAALDGLVSAGYITAAEGWVAGELKHVSVENGTQEWGS